MSDQTTKEDTTSTPTQSAQLSHWLRATVTLRQPRWVFVAAGLAGFILLLIAVD